MSLKTPCKYCGKEISIRKMPNGKHIPFDKWTNTQHRCLAPQDHGVKKSTGVRVESTQNYDANVSVGDLILQVISESPGIKAKLIASIISKKYGIQVDRSEVNRWLYRDLKNKVYQSSPYHWCVGGVDRSKYQNVAQNLRKDEISEHRTDMASYVQNNTQTKTNMLLWIVIAALVIIVLILLNKS
jgi:hypothetical protein